MRGMKPGQYAVWDWIQDHPTCREKAMQIWRFFYLINLCLKFIPLSGAMLFVLVSLGVSNWQGKNTEGLDVLIAIGFAVIGYFFTKYFVGRICQRLGRKLRAIVSDDKSRQILDIFRLTDTDSAIRIGRFLPN